MVEGLFVPSTIPFANLKFAQKSSAVGIFLTTALGNLENGLAVSLATAQGLLVATEGHHARKPKDPPNRDRGGFGDGADFRISAAGGGGVLEVRADVCP